MITYDRRMNKIAVRVGGEGAEYRVVFQSTNNRNAMYLERAFETLGKESPFGGDEKEITTFYSSPFESALSVMVSPSS